MKKYPSLAKASRILGEALIPHKGKASKPVRRVHFMKWNDERRTVCGLSARYFDVGPKQMVTCKNCLKRLPRDEG
jgi:hypothetical protein